ncbi:MAG: adenylate/guanylate cyclase domain-containing protein [Myxococcales bacterium]
MSAAHKIRGLLRPAPRTHNLAILLSDMKGFTARTSRQTREENARMLALHDALLVPVVKGFGGNKVKSIGDALLVTFRSPTDSVLCAMAMQDRLAAWNAKAEPVDRIEVRITVSLGEVQVKSSDIAGDPVQLALRASLHADAGDVVLTESVYLAMNKSEVPTEPFAVRELRAGQTRLHRARVTGPRDLPYSGHALRRLGKLRAPRLPLLPRAAKFLAHTWPAFAVVLFFAVMGGAAFRVRAERERDPVLRATLLLTQKAPTAALAELDKLGGEPRAKTAKVAVLRGKAEQELGQLGMAFADFAAALEDDKGVADAAVVRALVDDLDSDAFPVQWRSALVHTIADKIGAPAVEPLRALTNAKMWRTRRDALEALELMGKARDEDRVAFAAADLRDKAASCPAVLAAVRVLGMAATETAAKLLHEAAAEKRCGAREAKDALRRIERGTHPAKAEPPPAPASAVPVTSR